MQVYMYVHLEVAKISMIVQYNDVLCTVNSRYNAEHSRLQRSAAGAGSALRQRRFILVLLLQLDIT